MDGFSIVMHRHAKNNDFSIDFTIFTKALWMDEPTDKPMDGSTDGQTYPLREMRLPHLKSGKNFNLNLVNFLSISFVVEVMRNDRSEFGPFFGWRPQEGTKSC